MGRKRWATEEVSENNASLIMIKDRSIGMPDTCLQRESRDGQGHNRDKTIPLDLPEFKFLVRNLDAITDVQMTHHRYEDPSIDVYITWGFPVEKHK